MQSTLPKHTDNINIYRPHSNSDEDHYKAQFLPQDIPAGAYPPNSPHSRYDGRYIYDHEAVPPRPPLPSGLENSKYFSTIIVNNRKKIMNIKIVFT